MVIEKANLALLTHPDHGHYGEGTDHETGEQDTRLNITCEMCNARVFWCEKQLSYFHLNEGEWEACGPAHFVSARPLSEHLPH